MGISLNSIVSVVGSVLTAGGNPLYFNGVALSNFPYLPYGRVLSFVQPADVASFFGDSTASAYVSTVAPIAAPALFEGDQFKSKKGKLGAGPTGVNYIIVHAQVSGTIVPGMQTKGGNIPPGTYVIGKSTVTEGKFYLSQLTLDVITDPELATFSFVETDFSNVYFAGYQGKTQQPSALNFYRYALAPTAAFIVGGKLGATDLAALIAVTAGNLSLKYDGTTYSSSAIDLHSATTFSEIAIALAAALALPDDTLQITFDSRYSAFVFMDVATTGVSSTLTDITSSTMLDVALKITRPTGATIQPIGVVADTPAAAMNTLTNVFQNFVSFTTMWEPAIGDKEAFALWNSFLAPRYVYATVDSDVDIPTSSVSALRAYILNNSINGTAVVYEDILCIAGAMGYIACLDFNRLNGRTVADFRQFTGVAPTITDTTSAAYATANGANFYGQFENPNNLYNFFSNGQISGPYKWIDSYVNAVWICYNLQTANINLLMSVGQIPYNTLGYSLVYHAGLDPVNAALNYGAIRKGVPLSAEQAEAVNLEAGVAIDGVLSSVGWYYQISPATAEVRAARGTPPCSLWYMDGQSIQRLSIAAQMIQ